VGGMDALNKVKTVSMKGSGAFQGMTLEYAKKATTANKLFESLSMMGQAMTKVYDGKTGYQARGPQKMAIEGDDLKALQEEAHPFPEVNMLKANTLTIKGIETMNGSDAYALVAGDKTYFYDMTSGLKLGEAVKMNVQGQDMVMTTPYSDYKAVKGVLFPHKTAINVGVEIEINITEVKVNEGVTEADFK
jgi:zinc protease